jgi:hypothetical protein
MRSHLTKTLAALALVSAVAVGTAAPAMAQVYFGGPGVEIGVGPPWHHDYYYGRPYYHHHYWRHYRGDWD